MGINAIASAWGFAEATLFFIVPDVWLSYAARERLRPGLIACLYALAGALAGGALMYWWGSTDAERALSLIEALPAIDDAMIDRVATELSAQGLLAVMWGPVSGTPYKLYALQASNAGLSGTAFLLITIPARLLRFALVTVASHYVLKGLTHLAPQLNRTLCLIGAWIVFYVTYFAMMSS